MAAEPRGVDGRCTNCGATATGAYCARCGQRIEPHIHTVWGFLREATESLTHADSRLWRTLITLLVKPGQLTREFLDGRRASYLPPFRLYLVLSLLFFVVASLLGEADLVNFERQPPAQASAEKPREELTALEDLSKEAAALKASKDPNERKIGEELVKLVGKADDDKAGDEPPKARRCEFDVDGTSLTWLMVRFKRGCERVLAEGGTRLLGREVMANVPRMLFLFLPLIAFVMMLMYWLPRRYYVEHLLFFVHNHSFMFLLFVLLMLVTAPLSEGLAGVITFAAFAYAAWYVYRSMRIAYGQGRALTLVKYVTLGVVYLVLGAVLTALTFVYSVATV